MIFRNTSDKIRRRMKRKFHIRKTIHGSAARPRMTVTRSNCHLYIQAVDDDEGKTLAAISTLEKEFRGMRPTKETGAKLGEAFAARLKEKNISTVVFDRNGYLYHGVVAAIADGARNAGIVF